MTTKKNGGTGYLQRYIPGHISGAISVHIILLTIHFIDLVKNGGLFGNER